MNNGCGCGKCKKCRECQPMNMNFGCVKPCPEVCSETFDSRCVENFCDIQSTQFFIIVNNVPSQINVPGCISQFEFNQYMMLLHSSPQCITTGGNSRAVTYFYVEKVNQNTIRVHFNGIDTNYINPVYVEQGYDIVVKNVQNNTIYTFPLTLNPTKVYELSIGNPVILPGYTYEVHIVTKTADSNNLSNIATCNSLKHIIQM